MARENFSQMRRGNGNSDSLEAFSCASWHDEARPSVRWGKSEQGGVSLARGWKNNDESDHLLWRYSTELHCIPSPNPESWRV